MASEQLTRTYYRNPLLYPPGTPPPPRGTGYALRTGDATREEAALDQEAYFLPLERVHGSTLHEFGIADGLRVVAALGTLELRLEPGATVDVAGRHITLPVNG